MSLLKKNKRSGHRHRGEYHVAMDTERTWWTTDEGVQRLPAHNWTLKQRPATEAPSHSSGADPFISNFLPQ